MPGAHARLSASSSERWMACPGSVRLAEMLPPEPSSPYAAEGSAAHAFAERCLREGMDSFLLIGETLPEHPDYPLTAEMAEHVQTYLDYVRAHAGDASINVETRIENAALGTSFGGTCDAYARTTDCLHVFDFKYGAGVAVEVEDNPQMQYYAYGLIKTLGVAPETDVCLHIVQPRDPTGTPVRAMFTTAANILHWGDNELLPAMWAVDKPEAPLHLGEHCRWCPAKLICPKMRDNFEVFDTLATHDPKGLELSEEGLASLYACIPAVETFIRAIKDEVLKRAMAGSPIPGTKLVAGRADRVWKDGAEAAALEAFGEDAYTPKTVRSPAQIERLPGGKEFAATWAYKPEGKPTLAKADDKRAEVSAGAVYANVVG